MRQLFALLFVLAAAPLADAALIVTVGSTNLAPNGTGSVDVFVRSTGGDTLDLASLTFRITPVSYPPGSSLVSFANPQSDSHLTSLGYLFAGDSAAAFFGPPASSVFTTTLADDTYVGGDGTLSGLGVPVPTTDTLLARLDLVAGPGGASSFLITLDPSSSFNSPDFSPIAFSATPGVVSTPEPVAVLVFGGLLTAGGWVVRRRATRG